MRLLSPLMSIVSSCLAKAQHCWLLQQSMQAASEGAAALLSLLDTSFCFMRGPEMESHPKLELSAGATAGTER